jgi:hypothetical protein
LNYHRAMSVIVNWIPLLSAQCFYVTWKHCWYGSSSQIRMLELSSAGDRDAMDQAAAAARAEREQLNSELASTKDQLTTTSKVRSYDLDSKAFSWQAW